MQEKETYEPIIFTSLSAEEFRGNPTWCVTLNNGEKAYQKDGRKSWSELKEWLKQHPDIFIEHFHFIFRDNHIYIGGGKSGYFFSKGAQAWQNGPTQHLFIGGIVENNIIKRKKFIVPELILNELEAEDTYPVNHPEMQTGLIWKKNIQANI